MQMEGELICLKNLISSHLFLSSVKNLGKFTKNIKALYHYTNLEGAKGIISNKTFWASHIKFMNDSKEYSHGLEVCETIVQKLIQELPIGNLKRTY